MRIFIPVPLVTLATALVVSSCSANGGSTSQTTGNQLSAQADTIDTSGAQPATLLAQAPFTLSVIAHFNQPWAMTFLPGSPYALITEKSGKLILWKDGGEVVNVAGVPAVAYGGQGGLGDVILAPDFASTHHIYLSWIEAGDGGTYGAVVGRATLDRNGPPTLKNMQIIWQQDPKVTGRGHFSHRMAFSPDGQYLFITSGERQKFDPAQDMTQNLGKIIRLYPDGTVPADNPFADQGGITAQIWSLGHRNLLGIAFDGAGRLWEQEMGPRGGDEVNLITRGANYGYPLVSNGDHYDGKVIPDHATRPEFTAPKLWWNPSISPAGLVWYGGNLYPGWKNSLLLGALSGEGLIRIGIDGDSLHKSDRWDLGQRIRDVEVREDGTIWLLSDGEKGELIKIVPKPAG